MQEYFKLMAINYFSGINLSDFEKELSRALLVKKAIKKYYKSGQLNLRLNLNHTIILYNNFPFFARDILEHVIIPEYRPALYSFLKFLDRVSEKEYNSLPFDEHITKQLEKL